MLTSVTNQDGSSMQFFNCKAARRPAQSAFQGPLTQRDSPESAIPPSPPPPQRGPAELPVGGSDPPPRLEMRTLISDRAFGQDGGRLRRALLPILDLFRDRRLRQKCLVFVFKQAQRLVTLPLGKGKQTGESQVLNGLLKKIPGFKSE